MKVDDRLLNGLGVLVAVVRGGSLTIAGKSLNTSESGVSRAIARLPVLAIAAQIPSSEIGGGYSQETHPEHLLAQCSDYCVVVSHPGQMPRVLEIAIQTAISRRGVAVVVIPGDVALREATVASPRLLFHPPQPAPTRQAQRLRWLARS